MKKILLSDTWFLNKETQLSYNNSLVCALSNGQDSTFLFLFLFHLKKKGLVNFNLHYCQHFWQLQNFFSLEQIAKLGFFCNLAVFITLSENKILNENQARIWRKESMTRVLVLEKNQNLFLGHTFTDQNETILWFLIRGTSLKNFDLFKKQKFISVALIDSQFGIQGYPPRQPNSLIHFYKNKQTQKNLPDEFKPQGLNRPAYSSQNYFFLQNKLENKRFEKRKSNISVSRKKFSIIELKQINYKTDVLDKKKKSFTSLFYFKTQQKDFIISLPLLAFSRSYILEIMVRYNLPILTDTTNQSIYFSRNKIRYQLLPLIRILFSKKFDFLLNNFLEISKLNQDETTKNIENFQFLLSFQFFFYPRYSKTKAILKKQGGKGFLLNRIFINISTGKKKALLKNVYKKYSDKVLSFCNTKNFFKNLPNKSNKI